MMLKRPYVDFSQVKDRVSIPEALDKFGVLDQFKEGQGRWRGVCPLPQHKHVGSNDNQFVFDNKRETWLWHCFGDCQEGGDVIKLVMRMTEDDDPAHARLWFAEHFSEVLKLSKPKPVRQEKADEPREGQYRERSPVKTDDNTGGKSDFKVADGIKPRRSYLNLDIDAAEAYLAARGISRATAECYGVGMCGESSKSRMFKGYLCIPVYRWPKQSADENPVGYVGRWPGDDFDEEHPRYKMGFETGHALFGLGQALSETNESQPLLVVEGPLKALWLVDRGYTSTVSSFTSALTDEQAALLLQTGRPIVLAFDGDEAGWKGMRVGAGKLIAECFVRVVKLPAGKELDQLGGAKLGEFYGFAAPS